MVGWSPTPRIDSIPAMLGWSPGGPAGQSKDDELGWFWQAESDVRLAGAGDLSVGAYARVPVAVDLAGVGDLSVAASAIVPADVPLAGRGFYNAFVYAVVPAELALNGDGTLAVEAVQRYLRALGLSGSGELSSSAWESYSRDMAMSGAGLLASTAYARTPAGVPLAGLGDLSATASVIVPATVPLAGHGALSMAAYSIVPVSYGSTGAGKTVTGGNSTSSAVASWLDTLANDDTAILVGVSVRGARPNSSASGAECGGHAMTKLVELNNSGVYVAIFGLLDPPTGQQTVEVTGTWTGAIGSNGNTVAANSVSYKNAKAFGVPVTNSGSGGDTESVTIASAAKRMAFSILAQGSAFSNTAVSETSRWNVGTTILQDAIGVASIDFSATFSTFGLGIGAWSGAAVELLPA